MRHESVSLVSRDKVTVLETTMMVAYIHNQRNFNTLSNSFFFFSLQLLDFIRRLLWSSEFVVGGS